MSDAPTELAEFVVEITYREPGYQARSGAREEPYRFRRRVSARGVEHARALVLDEFQRVWEQSSVGWARVIVAVDVQPAPPA